MPVFDVVPHVGIGPLRLGMTQAEVRRAVAGHEVKPLRGCQEVVRDLGLWVDYPLGFAGVRFVQASRAKGVWVVFAGVDVFDTLADELVALVVRQQGLAPADFPPGRHEYLFPALRLALWRGVVADDPGERGWAFECISVHAPGYYDGQA
jgi:hypothetical protein